MQVGTIVTISVDTAILASSTDPGLIQAMAVRFRRRPPARRGTALDQPRAGASRFLVNGHSGIPVCSETATIVRSKSATAPVSAHRSPREFLNVEANIYFRLVEYDPRPAECKPVTVASLARQLVVGARQHERNGQCRRLRRVRAA